MGSGRPGVLVDMSSNQASLRESGAPSRCGTPTRCGTATSTTAAGTSSLAASARSPLSKDDAHAPVIPAFFIGVEGSLDYISLLDDRRSLAGSAAFPRQAGPAHAEVHGEISH